MRLFLLTDTGDEEIGDGACDEFVSDNDNEDAVECVVELSFCVCLVAVGDDNVISNDAVESVNDSFAGGFVYAFFIK